MSTPSRLSGGTRAIFMLSILVLSTGLIVTACETTIPQSTSNTETTTVTKLEWSFVPGEVLVKFKPFMSQERIDAILKENGTERITVIKGIGVHHVRIVGTESVDSVIKKFSTYQEIEYAEPNTLSRADQ